ncbi:hypothetical protein TKK_0002818 [Trichogramma kaykai]
MIPAMRRLIGLAWLCCVVIGQARAGCPLKPKTEQTSATRLPGDGGYRILISGEYDKYIPNAVYTIGLQGSGDFDQLERFERFTLSVDAQSPSSFERPYPRTGYFQIFPDSLTEFNEDCVNTVSESSDRPKSEVQVLWRAPPRGSGCVVFTAMVMEGPKRWYAGDGHLQRVFCEMSPRETESLDALRCCACDEAKYKMVLEGIWSNETHPKDFPQSVWLTRFSDVIGATHETNFSFWGRDHVASDGFRQLAEWGSVAGLEGEFQAKQRYLKTFIKAPGLWYPSMNSNTSASFEVDRRHPLLSIASSMGPSPDWVVGVSKLNLCQRDCSWIRRMTIDLYPWDAGTDSGISYMSANAETRPRELMKPITTMYPEDPRSPFYDPSGRPMLPVARLYLDRDELIKKSCYEQQQQQSHDVTDFDVRDIAAASGNTETDSGSGLGDRREDDCAMTDYSEWSACSVNCGKGVRTRKRSYRNPERATLIGCNEELVSQEICLGANGECKIAPTPRKKENEKVQQLAASVVEECETTDWSDWSECSATCGVAFRTRWRRLRRADHQNKCLRTKLTEKDRCVLPACPQDASEQQDDVCKVSDWSKWSACSATCGNGVKSRSRTLLVSPELRADCSRKVLLIQQRPCLDQADCTFAAAAAKGICSEKIHKGPCRGYFERWAYDPEKRACVSFVYGGCRGNRNNFRTYDDCTNSCATDSSSVVPTLESASTANSDVVVARHAPEDRLASLRSSDVLPLPTKQRQLTPVDCEVSEWSPWTDCNVTCGMGRMISTRYILRHPQNGGRSCPLRLERRAICQLAPCKSFEV